MIIKRDGTKEPFESEKIYKALFKAFIACGYPDNKVTKKAITKILKHIDEASMETVEDVQDEVENLLMDKHYYDVAKAYIIYREKHSQLRNFTDHKIQFIQKYRKSDNTANSTVDDNSNVNGKNIGILNAEIHKEDNIQISRRMVVAKLKEIFPDFDAFQYQKDLNHHIIYKHDESSFAGAIAPYTYSPKETVEVKYGSNHWLVALDTLYNLINDTEEVLLDKDKEVYAKFPEELYIKDKNDFTLVTRLIKKRRHRPLVRVKTSFGEDLIVTDNHPLIVSDNIEETIEANKAQGYQQLRLPSDIHFDGITEIDISKHLVCSAVYKNYILQQQESFCTYSACKRYIQLDEYFGYIVGFFIGDGHYDNGKSVLSFTQKEKETLEILAEYIYQSTGVMSTIEYKKDKINCWRMQVHSKALFILFKEYFQIKDYAQNKNLPINILETNEVFAKGIIEGLIDSDGTIQNNGAGVLLRLASREAINQMTTLLRYFNFGVANTIQNLPFSNNTQYNTNYTIWGVSFNNTVGATKLTLSYKWKTKINREITKYVKYATGWANIDSVSELENSSFIQQCDYIYDITTESHTFNSSNLLVHNCTSITMYPFLLEGLKKIGGLSAAPKNLDSFCGMYINLIFAIAAMYAGAIATSEFLLYFTYFCKKEWGEDFYQHPDKEITVNSARSKTIRSQIHQYWQQVIYSINQPAAARGLQSAFVNFSYFDHPFFDGMFGDFYFPDGTKPDWESLCWIQKEFMQWFNQERLKCILTFPVESFALVYKDGEFLDKDSADFVVEEYARGHSFFTYISDTVDSLSSCCRLKNMITTKEFNFTNGNMGVQTGSKSVITLNLNRIIQDWYRGWHTKEDSKVGGSLGIDWSEDSEDLQHYLKHILERVYKYHTAYNELLWDMYDANLLPVYKAGFINLNKQYLTIGLNGLNQAAEFLGISCTDNADYSKFCQLIFGTIKEANAEAKGTFNKHKLTFNTECVPAESLAIKNYNWDKEDGYKVPTDTNLYASYIFKPNDANTTVLNRLKLHGNNYIGEFLDGGWLRWAS